MGHVNVSSWESVSRNLPVAALLGDSNSTVVF